MRASSNVDDDGFNSNLWSNDEGLPTRADTYAKRLRAKGYRTATIGESHLHGTLIFLLMRDDVYETPGILRNIRGDNLQICHLRKCGLDEALSL